MLLLSLALAAIAGTAGTSFRETVTSTERGIKMKRSRIAGFILMVLVTSCTRPEKSLAIPDLKEVKSVKVFHLKAPIWEREMREPKQIDELLAHFRKHNTGYYTNTRLHEWLFGSRYDDSYEYRLIFEGKGSSPSPMMVWIGPKGLGGEDFRRGEPWLIRDRWLSASELKSLIAIIGERTRVERAARGSPRPAVQSADPAHAKDARALCLTGK